MSFGGLVAYVGKSIESKPFDHLLEPHSQRTVDTVKRNIERVIDQSKYDVCFRVGRCLDSSLDGANPDPNFGTEHEEPISGAERMTKYVVALITRKPVAGPSL